MTLDPNDYYVQIKNTESLHPKHSIVKGNNAAIKISITLFIVHWEVRGTDQQRSLEFDRGQKYKCDLSNYSIHRSKSAKCW